MSRQKPPGRREAPAPSDPGTGKAGPAPETDKPKQPEATVEQLRREIEQANDRYLRTLAEFENARKRLQREKDEFAKYAAEAIVRELLPIVDSLNQALVAVDRQSDADPVVKGVHLIYRQMLGLLEKEGVKRIPTVGERFDPHRHEAVAQVEVKDGQPDHTIAEEVQVGYTMHGKVIRPAMVKVTTPSDPQAAGHGPAAEPPGEDAKP